MTHDLALPGCNPTPLGSYLKSLAVHRVVAIQGDPAASSYWDGDRVFHLVSAFDRGSLLTFFLERYAPTPLVTPWNGGSGFFPKDQKSGFDAVARSKEARFAPYRAAIEGGRALLKEIGLKEKPNPDAKLRLLRLARARLADSVVEWLDAAFVLTEDVRYPALLGTGGNDGRLEFANNFMQRLVELFPPGQKASSDDAARMLEATLLARPSPDVARKVAVGQFAPGRAGGSNMTAGLEADARVNPWDFVLALEGSLLFAGAAVRRLDVAEYGSASYPFHVNASSVGYGSAATPDEGSARAELWLPLWQRPASFGELKALFAEGRLELKGRRARTGLDAARAVASLGVDRGVETFERIGILRRNGLSYLASSLGTLRVREIPSVELMRELDVNARSHGRRKLDRRSARCNASPVTGSPPAPTDRPSSPWPPPSPPGASASTWSRSMTAADAGPNARSPGPIAIRWRTWSPSLSGGSSLPMRRPCLSTALRS